MPPLENVQHEMFALAVADGKTTLEAYDHAGYQGQGKARNVGAAKINAREDVQARISQLKAPAVARAVAEAQISREWITAQLIENAMVCMGKQPIKLKVYDKKIGEVKEVEVTVHEPTAANAALIALGKDLGMFEERQHNTGDTYNIVAPQPAQISPERTQEQIENDWMASVRNVTPARGALVSPAAPPKAAQD